MERTTALKRLRKLLGNSLGYRVDTKAPTAEERAAARERLPALAAEKKSLSEALEARRAEVLAADEMYQHLHANLAKVRAEWEAAAATARHFKFTVGVSRDLFFWVKAQGDSWEDVIRQLEAKK